MDWAVPKEIEEKVDALVQRYPKPRSAVVMVLHALQEHFGYISPQAIEWTARKLGLRPINVLELVTFYPMFRREPFGKFHLRICRTLSCALAGSHQLHRHICERLGLNPEKPGPQTSADGLFTVEFVECLASCGTAPVIMCNETQHEQMTVEQVDKLLDECRCKCRKERAGDLAAEHGFEP